MRSAARPSRWARQISMLVVAATAGVVVGAAMSAGPTGGAPTELVGCDPLSPESVSGFAYVSPGLKPNNETAQGVKLGANLDGCDADEVRLAALLPAGTLANGVPAAQGNQIVRAQVKFVGRMYDDCLDATTPAVDLDTSSEYPLYGKLAIRWTNESGGSISGVKTSYAYVRGTWSYGTRSFVLTGTVAKGLGGGGDLSVAGKLNPPTASAAAYDECVEGEPPGEIDLLDFLPTSVSIVLP